MDKKYLHDFFGENREEISGAVKQAREGVERLVEFCLPADLREQLNPSESERERISERGYVLDLLTNYIVDGGVDTEQSMKLFADNHQVPYENVKAILEYLDLKV